MAKHRNVLLIVADQWRGDSLGVLGHPSALTPNLDALARDGMTFRSHFGQSAPCGPARASLLTGLYVMNHRVVANGVPLDARHPTLAREVKQAGIDPALVGYTTTTPDPRVVGPGDGLRGFMAFARQQYDVTRRQQFHHTINGRPPVSNFFNV